MVDIALFLLLSVGTVFLIMIIAFIVSLILTIKNFNKKYYIDSNNNKNINKDIKPLTADDYNPYKNEQQVVDNNVVNNEMVSNNTVIEKKEFNKKNLKIIIPIVSVVLVLLISVVSIYLINDNNNKKKIEKYDQAIKYYNEGNYDNAEKLFNEINEYQRSNGYLNNIKAKKLTDEEKIDEAYELYINSGVEDTSLEKYLKAYVNYNNKNYKYIYEEYKNFNINNYSGKEKEIVIDGLYLYGKQMKDEGYYTTSKECFNKTIGYKDTDNLLKDKYYKLIGNGYTYTVSSGTNWGVVSILFYSYGDKVLYNVFTQSLFNTNIPKGFDYNYRIKNNTLYIGNYIKYKIVSVSDNNLVIQDGKAKFNLKKD